MDKETKEEVLHLTKIIYKNMINSTKGLSTEIITHEFFVTGVFNAVTNLLCQVASIAGLTEDQILENVKQIWKGVKEMEDLDFLN